MKPLLVIGLLLAAIASSGEPAVMRTAAEMGRSSFCDADVGRAFDLTGTILSVKARQRPMHFTIGDDTGTHTLVRVPTLPPDAFTIGNRVRIRGHIISPLPGIYGEQVEQVEVLGYEPPPAPVETDIPSILRGSPSRHPVRFHGLVKDIQPDDLDPNWTILTLYGDGETVCTFLCTDRNPLPESYLGAEVRITGFCSTYPPGHRHFLGNKIDIHEIEILKPADDDLFSAPPLEILQNATPRNLLALGRRTVTGRVLAICRSGRTIIRTANGNISHISFATGDLPRIGDTVDISGLPQTDLYRLNLSHALWRRSAAASIPAEDPPRDVTASDVLLSIDGRKRVQLRYHGSSVRIRGEVLTLPAVGNDDGILHLRDGRFVVPVDVSACPDALIGVTAGCTVRIEGVCVLQQDEQTSVGRLPNFRDFTVVMRSPRDLEVIARPPWWTPARLVAVIGTLLAVLLGIVVWNLMLRRLAERRGRELAAENVARAESDLRVYERTRLAVELHDSIAQNLSGVSLELDAARDFGGENPGEMTRHLDIAARTLKSCRGELRNCMWDLRNQTLEDERMDDAIRRTLAPHLGGASLAVRFDVPRERLSDNTALAILRIIRELTVNAVRHGHAKSIHVAGCVEDGRLMFSVRDDGCGFDPGSRPGIEDGHFGLQGVSERIEGFNGGISIASAPGHGAKITVRIPIPGACAPQGEKR